MRSNRLGMSLAGMAMAALMAPRASMAPVVVEDVESPKGKDMNFVDVEGAALPPVKHSVGEAIQLSNDVVYYEEQLKIIASEIAEAKALDKMSRFTKTAKVKELLGVIKDHRKIIQGYVNKHLDAAKHNKILSRGEVFNAFVKDTAAVSDMKLALFKEIRKHCADSGYVSKR